MENHTVIFGESLWDICLNKTGSLSNLNAILEANSFTDWTPSLLAGQTVIIPDGLFMDSNNIRELAKYPACNNSVGDVIAKIISIFASVDSGWILTTGFWVDTQLWKDEQNWVDHI